MILRTDEAQAKADTIPVKCNQLYRRKLPGDNIVVRIVTNLTIKILKKGARGAIVL